MRIHTIRLANLNALTGTWEIDLDHPAYNDNIYALTGPTGAGKTTILDAISLALYGRTPRLARIGKAGNEIMSRHSGTCHAEITFSTRTGRYRSHWSQHRARRKAGGELQNPKHELADADSGELLATGLKDVAAAIERLTGMDYQRFTRAMLLAQGDFAAFLRAAPDERAPLLEQITGTEIYSRISIAVHERLRDALEQQRQLATETAGITPLDAATHTALTQESAALQKQLAALATRQQQTAAALARAQNIAELTAELARLDEQHTAHQAALARFAPERERLAAAQSAALLDADYARLDTLRRAQQQNRAALAALDEQAPALARAHETANQALTAASARVHSEKQRLAAAQPRWQQTRAYDHTLRHQREQLATLEQSAAAHTAAQTALAAAEKHAAAARENSARADVARKKTETALAAHLQGRLLREYQTEKENILRELAYHQRIADLEQQRAHLHDGEPCPLCGATEHPYASELPAQPDDLTARLETLDTYIKRAETLGEQHENAQRALASAREKQQQTENTLALAAEKARNSAVHAEQHAALQQTHAQTLAARQALLANRDPDAEETAQQRAITEAEAAMEKARDTCQTAQTAAAANQQQRAQLHARLTAQQQELQTAEQQFAAALGMCSEIAAPSPAGRSRSGGGMGRGWTMFLAHQRFPPFQSAITLTPIHPRAQRQHSLTKPPGRPHACPPPHAKRSPAKPPRWTNKPSPCTPANKTAPPALPPSPHKAPTTPTPPPCKRAKKPTNTPDNNTNKPSPQTNTASPNTNAPASALPPNNKPSQNKPPKPGAGKTCTNSSARRTAKNTATTHKA